MDFQIRPAQASEAVAKPSATILLHSLGAKRLLMTRTGYKDIWCQPRGDDAQFDRVAAEGKQHGNVCYRRHRAGCGTARNGQVNVTPLQFGYHLPQRSGIASRVVQLKDDVFS